MVGHERRDESLRAQLFARGLKEYPKATGPPRQPVYHMPKMYGDAAVGAEIWGAESTREVAASTRKTGNHICRTDVCHKGKIGRMGFCRFVFWHLGPGHVPEGRADGCKGARHAPAATVEVIRRRAACLQGSPHRGMATLEQAHPFHIKMSPGITLGPRCNHDLGILLCLLTKRIPDAACGSGVRIARDLESELSPALTACTTTEARPILVPPVAQLRL